MVKPRIGLLLIATGMFVGGVACGVGRVFPGPEPVGHIENPSITEASGLAASRLRNDVFWVINDSGNAPVLYAMDARGRHLGTVAVEDSSNQDWEDLASFVHDGTAFLAIADIGDNAARRDACTIYIVREPGLSPDGPPPEARVVPVRRIRFTYEDGPRDCEAIAFDEPARRFLLISKRTRPPVLYALPFEEGRDDTVWVAIRSTDVANLQDAAEKHRNPGRLLEPNPYRYLPTALDISPDASLLAILTYQYVFVFHRSNPQEWASALGLPPKVYPLPRLPQAEALCFGADGRSLLITSEKYPAPILRIPVP